jgi:hypothetical protein
VKVNRVQRGSSGPQKVVSRQQARFPGYRGIVSSIFTELLSNTSVIKGAWIDGDYDPVSLQITFPTGEKPVLTFTVSRCPSIL